MSFILEALKKSQQERALGAVPSLQTVHQGERRSRSWLTRLLMWLILLSLAAAAAYHYRQPIMLVMSSYLLREKVNPQASAPAPAPVQPKRTVAAESEDPVASGPPQSPILAAGSSRPSPPSTTAAKANLPPEEDQLAQPEAVSDAGNGEVIRPQLQAADIPLAVQSKADALTINVVSYSEDARKRFVMIDQTIYKEGASIGGDIVIEEITPDGPRLKIGAYLLLARPK